MIVSLVTRQFGGHNDLKKFKRLSLTAIGMTDFALLDESTYSCLPEKREKVNILLE